jgi:hypothetical protein
MNQLQFGTMLKDYELSPLLDITIEDFVYYVYECVREWWLGHFMLSNLVERLGEKDVLDQFIEDIPNIYVIGHENVKAIDLINKALVKRYSPQKCLSCGAISFGDWETFEHCEHLETDDAEPRDLRKDVGNYAEYIEKNCITEEFIHFHSRECVAALLGRFGPSVFEGVTAWMHSFPVAVDSKSGEEIMSQLMAGLSLLHHQGELVREHGDGLEDAIDLIRKEGPAKCWGRDTYIEFITSYNIGNMLGERISDEELDETEEFVKDLGYF